MLTIISSDYCRTNPFETVSCERKYGIECLGAAESAFRQGCRKRKREKGRRPCSRAPAPA